MITAMKREEGQKRRDIVLLQWTTSITHMPEEEDEGEERERTKKGGRIREFRGGNVGKVRDVMSPFSLDRRNTLSDFTQDRSICPPCDMEPLSSLHGPADKSLTPIPRYLPTFLFPSFFPSSPSLWGTLPKKCSLLSRGYQFSESLRRHFGKKCGFHQREIFLFSPSAGRKEEGDERIQVWNSPRIQEQECERFVFLAPSLSGRRLKCTF